MPDAGAARAIAEGRHGDPFALLGPHDGVVTAFVPGAAALTLLPTDGAPIPMAPHPEVGDLFTAPMREPSTACAGAAITAPNGISTIPTASAMCWARSTNICLGEGRHNRLWDALGAHADHP